MSETPAVDWDRLKVDDPTPLSVILQCEQLCWERDRAGFACSRAPGHGGQHVAAGLSGIKATWPGETP